MHAQSVIVVEYGGCVYVFGGEKDNGRGGW